MKKALWLAFFLIIVCCFIFSACDNVDSPDDKDISIDDNTSPAPEEEPIENESAILKYELNADGETYSVTGCEDNIESSIIIPDTYKGKPVTILSSLYLGKCVTTISIGKNVTEIDPTFASTTLESIIVSERNNHFKSIDGNLYTRDGKTLVKYAVGKKNTTFEIPNDVTNIGNYAFVLNKHLTNITIGNNVSTIGFQAFALCDNLQRVNIEDSVTNIGEYAFSSCQKLTNITIGDGATIISREAFRDCRNLAVVTIGNAVTSIDPSAFNLCTSLISINVSKENPAYQSIDGSLYSKDGKTMIMYALGKADTSFSIPDHVTDIGDWAFAYSPNLNNIIIGNSIINIGECAFVRCDNLTNVTIGDSVTTILESAFACCENLTVVTISSSVTSIASSAFNGCTSLISINVSKENLSYQSIDGNLYSKDGKTLMQYALGKADTSFSIPDHVTNIGERAFACSKLNNIIIGNSVKYIGGEAFNGYNIEKITFEGTLEEWKSIKKGSIMGELSINIPVYCTDGQTNTLE